MGLPLLFVGARHGQLEPAEILHLQVHLVHRLRFQIHGQRVLADGPKLRRLLVDLKKQSELYIDEFTRDAVISTGFDEKAARETVAKFSDFLDQHQDELTALTILYGKPARLARLTYESIEELRHALAKPPWLLEPVSIWAAYKRLSEGRITADPARVLTELVAMTRCLFLAPAGAVGRGMRR